MPIPLSPWRKFFLVVLLLILIAYLAMIIAACTEGSNEAPPQADEAAWEGLNVEEKKREKRVEDA